MGSRDPHDRKPLEKPSGVNQSTKEEAAEFLQAEIARQTARANNLEKDMAALISEYVNASDEDAPDVMKKNIRSRGPLALTVIDELLMTGSDGVKSSLAKWIIDRGLMKEATDPTTNPDTELADLLKDMQSND